MAYKMTVVNPAPKGGRKMAKKKTGGRKKASKKKTKKGKRKLSAKQKAALAKGRKKAAAMRKKTKKTTKRKTKKKVAKKKTAKRKVKRKTKKKVAKKKVAKRKTKKKVAKRKVKRKTKKKATKKKATKKKATKKVAKRKTKKTAKRKTKKVAKRKVTKVAKPRRRRPPMPAGVPRIKYTPDEAEERLSGAGGVVGKARGKSKRKRRGIRGISKAGRRMQLAGHGYLQLNPEDNPVEQVPGHRGLFVVTPPKKGKVRSKAVVMRTGKGRDPTKAGRGAVPRRKVSTKRASEIKRIRSQMGRL